MERIILQKLHISGSKNDTIKDRPSPLNSSGAFAISAITSNKAAQPVAHAHRGKFQSENHHRVIWNTVPNVSP